MAKSRSKSQVEQLRGIIKQLKKEIRRKEKREHHYEDLEEREAECFLKEQEAEIEKLKIEKCPKCGAELDVTGGNRVKLYFCTSCNYRASKRK